MRRYIGIFVLALSFFSLAPVAQADQLQPPSQQPTPLSTGECVVQWFDSLMVVHKDSSASVTETLEVDCGQIPNKHGIFRTIPYKFPRRLASEYPITVINLRSISNAVGTPYLVETSYGKGTVTWKIGDPNTLIKGLNTYKIEYDVENIVDHGDSQDLVAWNMTGNFWTMDIERFTGRIQFPADLEQETLMPKIYSGPAGTKENTLATGRWLSKDELNGVGPTYYVQSIDVIGSPAHEGITTYVATPKYFEVYKVPLLIKYGRDAWFFLPLIMLLLALLTWSKYGRDPRPPGSQMVFYEAPLRLRPLQLGMVDTYGRLNTKFITATIVDLAARNCLTITEIGKKNMFGKVDWEFTLLVSNPSLMPYETAILRGIFSNLDEGTTVKASSLSNNFYTHLQSITDFAKSDLYELDILDKVAEGRQSFMLGGGVLLLAAMAGMFILSNMSNPMTNWLQYAPYSVGLSAIILILMSLLMGKRSEKGAQVEYELKGFREFLSATEKYRARFNEEKGIIERLLPYAVLFGVTDKFMKGLRSIYTEEQLGHMYPLWYVPIAHGATPDFASFASFTNSLNAMTTQVGSWAQSTPSGGGSGGGGGGGFSGGGFGGGGGGSW